jgi:predicted membrane protein
MGYVAIALMIIGVATGMMLRLRVLLSLVALLFVVSTVAAAANGYSALMTALTVLAAQTILQVSYFLGLVIAAVFPSAAHARRISAGYATLPPESATGRRKIYHGF